MLCRWVQRRRAQPRHPLAGRVHRHM